MTTKTTEFLTRTSEKIHHSEDAVTKELSELQMTTAVIEDPSLLKKKLMDSTLTTTTTVTSSNGDTETTTVTTNGANGDEIHADEIQVQ